MHELIKTKITFDQYIWCSHILYQSIVFQHLYSNNVRSIKKMFMNFLEVETIRNEKYTTLLWWTFQQSYLFVILSLNFIFLNFCFKFRFFICIVGCVCVYYIYKNFLKHCINSFMGDWIESEARKRAAQGTKWKAHKKLNRNFCI